MNRTNLEVATEIKKYLQIATQALGWATEALDDNDQYEGTELEELWHPILSAQFELENALLKTMTNMVKVVQK